MENIEIGNWLITKDGIIWNGSPKIDYFISKERIAEAGPDDRKEMYDFLVHLVEKTWITEKDIYALNTAFVFALEHFGIGFNTGLSFVKTFIEQQRELQDK